MKQQIYFGPQSLLELRSVLSKHRPMNILLFIGKSSFKKSGAEEALKGILPWNQVSFYDDFGEGPQLEDIQRGLEILKKRPIDLMMAIGGGTVLDFAKLIRIFLANNQVDSDEFISNPSSEYFTQRGIPLVAVPTTAGTGSESTQFAVIYRNKKKYSVDHPFLLPDYCFIDPNLTLSLSSYVTAVSGLDCLAQAMESYWSVRANSESLQYAFTAMEKCLKFLPLAVWDNDPMARTEMASAAHYAGRAINITRTTAAHALSYTLTSYYHIPHGHAVAVTLPAFFQFNGSVTEDNCVHPEGPHLVKKRMLEIEKLLKAENFLDGKMKLKKFIQSLGIEIDLDALGIKGKNFYNKILENVNLDRLKNNPVRINEEDIHQILVDSGWVPSITDPGIREVSGIGAQE